MIPKIFVRSSSEQLALDLPLMMLTSNCLSEKNCHWTMLMLKWIFIILSLVKSVFSCEPSKPSDPCCPDEDECCDEDVWGVCCRENRNMYISKFKPTFHQEWVHVCMCTTSIPSIHGRSGMCLFENETNS